MEENEQRAGWLPWESQGSLSTLWFCQSRKWLLVWYSYWSCRFQGRTYSFTLTSRARLISALEPGVISMNCRPIERLAASIYSESYHLATFQGRVEGLWNIQAYQLPSFCWQSPCTHHCGKKKRSVRELKSPTILAKGHSNIQFIQAANRWAHGLPQRQ